VQHFLRLISSDDRQPSFAQKLSSRRAMTYPANDERRRRVDQFELWFKENANGVLAGCLSSEPKAA